ncbi:MAG: hypothetical protein ACRD6W_03125, partial [Nitrososphaerales archaeon]
MVGGEFHDACSGHIPEEAISTIGKRKGDANLGIALDQFERYALLVEQPVLMLAQPVYALTEKGIEGDITPVKVSVTGPVTSLRRRRKMRDLFAEQVLPVGADETDQRRELEERAVPRCGNLDDEVAVPQPCPTVRNFHFRSCRPWMN